MVIFSRFHVCRASVLQSGFQLFIPLHDKVVLELLSMRKPGGGWPKVTHSVTTLNLRQLLSLQYSDDQAAAKSSWTQERPRGPDQAQGEEVRCLERRASLASGTQFCPASELRDSGSCLCCCFC